MMLTLEVGSARRARRMGAPFELVAPNMAMLCWSRTWYLDAVQTAIQVKLDMFSAMIVYSHAAVQVVSSHLAMPNFWSYRQPTMDWPPHSRIMKNWLSSTSHHVAASSISINIASAASFVMVERTCSCMVDAV